MIKNRNILHKIMAILLLLSFVLPSVANAMHYAFIEHLPQKYGKTKEVSNFHANCELDDYSFAQSPDIKNHDDIILYVINSKQDIYTKNLFVFAYRHYTFLLRAPPFLIDN